MHGDPYSWPHLRLDEKERSLPIKEAFFYVLEGPASFFLKKVFFPPMYNGEIGAVQSAANNLLSIVV